MARLWPWMSMIAIVGVVTLAPSFTLHAADDPIADRKANRKQVGEQAKAIKTVVDAGGPAASIVEPVKKILELEPGFMKDFPPGSDSGDTKALPTVWSDWKGFETASSNLTTEATKLLQLASAGAPEDQIKAQFGAMGKACGGCHTTYRAK
jgi:cytochrome c556